MFDVDTGVTFDQQEPTVARTKSERPHDKTTAKNEQMKAFKNIEVQLGKTEHKQIYLTDPDAHL